LSTESRIRNIQFFARGFVVPELGTGPDDCSPEELRALQGKIKQWYCRPLDLGNLLMKHQEGFGSRNWQDLVVSVAFVSMRRTFKTGWVLIVVQFDASRARWVCPPSLPSLFVLPVVASLQLL
jgi:hypothetical protein